MQPFDALTIRAVLQEAKPLLINRKVDRIMQLGRDELLLSLRSKSGLLSVFISAQSVYGRMCVVSTDGGDSGGADKASTVRRNMFGEKSVQERYQSKYGTGAPPNFCLVLRKHLTGAMLVGVEQVPGERVIDFIFSCTDEVGTASLKVLTAEIMGRHSNLIFWDKESQKILSSSHAVTKDMSRQREVMPNLPYERPPGQDRPSIFSISENEFKNRVRELKDLIRENNVHGASLQAVDSAALTASSRSDAVSGGDEMGTVVGASRTAVADGGRPKQEGGRSQAGVTRPTPITLEQWLISTFAGIGKHLGEEIISATGLDSILANSHQKDDLEDILWEKIKSIQLPEQYNPAVKTDLSRYTVLGWCSDMGDESTWSEFGSVNEMVEYYFRTLEAREQFLQLREKIKSEIVAEMSKLETRKEIAGQHISAEVEIERLKKSGDIILASIHSISHGQSDLVVSDWAADDGSTVTIRLNSNLSAVQNAQSYYRQYAKLRSRQGAAQGTINEVARRLDYLNQLRSSCEAATDMAELRRIKENFSGRRLQEKPQRTTSQRPNSQPSNDQARRSKAKPKMMNLTSSDGWTIYVGRNRHENDQLINKIANPSDVWLHVLGQGGAHVLIRVPSNKQDPPQSTIREAAEIAARLSKAPVGSKVRVIYTQCRFVKKVDPSRPGLVRYEQEKTIEIDTAKPMPPLMKKMFS